MKINTRIVDFIGSMIMIVAIVFLIAFWFVVGYVAAIGME